MKINVTHSNGAQGILLSDAIVTAWEDSDGEISIYGIMTDRPVFFKAEGELLAALDSPEFLAGKDPEDGKSVWMRKTAICFCGKSDPAVVVMSRFGGSLPFQADLLDEVKAILDANDK